MSGQLTAAEAAARLGVQRSTLYAYVSRGLIGRTVAMDGRTSLFDAAEVEQLRAGRRTATEGQLATLVTTRITQVTPEGLSIRGRSIDELLDGDGTFEAAVDHLWNSATDEIWPVPDHDREPLVFPGSPPDSMRPLDRLRIVAALESSADPLRYDISPQSVRAIGRELISSMVLSFPQRDERWSGKLEDSLADHLWVRLSSRKGTIAQRRALRIALVVLIDHGLAGSTLAARVAASVRADPYSVVLTGLGTLGGALHGAASAPVHELFAAASEASDVAQAVGHAQQIHGRLPGFGHSVYQGTDPRCAPLLKIVEQAWAKDPRLEVISRVADVVSARTDTFPNIDFALGALSWLAHMSPDAGEAIFAISRSAGWLAHAIEEYSEQPLRFRGRARYVPDQSAVLSQLD